MTNPAYVKNMNIFLLSYPKSAQNNWIVECPVNLGLEFFKSLLYFLYIV